MSHLTRLAADKGLAMAIVSQPVTAKGFEPGAYLCRGCAFEPSALEPSPLKPSEAPLSSGARCRRDLQEHCQAASTLRYSMSAPSGLMESESGHQWLRARRAPLHGAAHSLPLAMAVTRDTRKLWTVSARCWAGTRRGCCRPKKWKLKC